MLYAVLCLSSFLVLVVCVVELVLFSFFVLVLREVAFELVKVVGFGDIIVGACVNWLLVSDMTVVVDFVNCTSFGVTFLVAEVFMVVSLSSDNIVDAAVVVDSDALCFANFESNDFTFTMFFSKSDLFSFLFSVGEIIFKSFVGHGLF